MRFLSKLLVALVILLVVAQASKAAEPLDFCDAVSQLAYLSALQRDKGVASSEVIREATRKVRNDASRELIATVIVTVYNNPNINPERAAKLTDAACRRVPTGKGQL